MSAAESDVPMGSTDTLGSEDSSSSDEEQVESMLSTRTKRVGAHKKFQASIAQYLEVEDVEESYQKMFGEKFEGDVSDEFEADSSSDVDSADSDFSDSEPDDDQAEETKENAVQDEELDEKRKKKQQMKNALSKGPVRRARPVAATVSTAAEASNNVATITTDTAGPTNTSAAVPSLQSVFKEERRSSRKQSVQDREEKEKSRLERKKMAESIAQKRKPVVKHAKLTQAQRLEAAKETEKINMADLDYYTKLELERKKKRAIKKRTIPNPVRFRSVAVRGQSGANGEREGREYITFGDVSRFPEQYFDQSRPTPKRRKCDVTGAPASFFDPVTKKPYATMEAFKTLRTNNTAVVP